MIKFSNLQIETKQSNTTGKINVAKGLLNIKQKKPKAELREIEPGFKVGTGEFQSVSQYCDICENVESHCHKPEKRKMVCLKCKTIKIY